MATSRATSTHARIMAAARRLAAEKPLDRIGLSEVARQAGVSWPTVKRQVGSKEKLRQALVDEQPELAHALPDTRTRLLDAAVKVFAKDGYEGATLDEIAREAGMTKGAVYWHFDAKQEVFGGLLQEYARRQAALARQDAEEAAAVGEARLAWERLLGLQLQRAQASPEWPKLLLEFAARGGKAPSRESVGVVLGTIPEAAADLARKLQERGLMADDADPSAVGTMVGALIHGLLLATLVDPSSIDPNAIAPLAARLLSQGLSDSSKD